MKKPFSLDNSLEILAALFAAGATLGVLQTFIIGKHFVIPTMVLLLVIYFGNLARFGLKGERWAKRTLLHGGRARDGFIPCRSGSERGIPGI